MKIENQQYIFGVIFLLANKLQLLGDKVTSELTFKQWFLLNMIKQMGNETPNYNDIAKVVGTSRQNVSKIISSLHKKGMVDLNLSSTDQRAIYVSLTQKCLDYFALKDNSANILLNQIFSDTSPEEINQLSTLLGKMLKNTETFLQDE